MEKGWTQSLYFCNFDLLFPTEDGLLNRKKYIFTWKNFSHWAIQVCQNQGSISCPLSRKDANTFCNIIGRKQGEVKGSESKCDASFFTHTIPDQVVMKNVCCNTFQFCGYRSQRTFHKNLTQIFECGCFSWYHAYIFEKKKVDCLMQNLMLKRLAPISKPKN